MTSDVSEHKLDREDGFKEICAHFGAAMYFAQVLEHGIANALLFLDLLPRTNGNWSPEQYDEFFDTNFEKTLGNLIKALKSVSSMPPELEAALLEAKQRRAFLAHHFFRERIDDVHLEEFEKLLAELEGHRAFFEATDKALDAFVQPVMKRHGIDEEWMEKALHDYKEQLAPTLSTSR